MQYKLVLMQGVLLALMVNLCGCFSSNPADIEAFLRPEQVDVTAEQYILQPPDEIEIHCSKVPEIDLQQQQIRPDGNIRFEALGEIQAAGRTPDQLADVLREKVSSLYTLAGEEPIDVRILVFRSKVYYVLGEVYLPGPKEYTGRDRVLHAIAISRPAPTGWVQRVQVIRPSSDKNIKPKIFELDFERMMAHGDTSKNVLLQEGDIVYVPPTVLAGIAMKVEEAVRPIARAFSTVNIVMPERRYGR